MAGSPAGTPARWTVPGSSSRRPWWSPRRGAGDLGAHDDLVAVPVQRGAEEALRRPVLGAVVGRRVEQGDAGLQGRMHQRARLVLIKTQAKRVAAEGHRRDGEPGAAELAVPHARTSCTPYRR